MNERRSMFGFFDLRLLDGANVAGRDDLPVDHLPPCVEIVGATILVLLYPNLKPSEVAGTDIAYAVPLTAIAAFGHWWLGSINWELLVTLLLGSVPGITLGSLVSRSVPEKFLRGLLAATLTGVAAKLVL